MAEVREPGPLVLQEAAKDVRINEGTAGVGSTRAHAADTELFPSVSMTGSPDR